MTHNFWTKLDGILIKSEKIIDRPKGSAHPKYPALIYPLDYGFLENTKSSDGNEIDIWIGSLEEKYLDAILCTVDILKNDTEIKLLLGCTIDEKNEILEFHNNSEYMSAILIERNK